jgi:hypothetical protein
MPNLSSEDRDSKPPVWDMSQERVLMEQNLAQRFNFFLLFFALVIGGALNAREQLHFQVVLTLGAFISGVLTAALSRTATRLNAVLENLRTDPTHPYTIISTTVGDRGVRKWLWQYLPRACFGCLVIAAALSWLSVLHVAPRP